MQAVQVRRNLLQISYLYEDSADSIFEILKSSSAEQQKDSHHSFS